MAFVEEFRSAGVLPKGPVSAWPKERHDKLMALSMADRVHPSKAASSEPKAMPGIKKMAGGLLRTGRQALINGKVQSHVREGRYAICKTCPSFDSKSKRCGECGCFMEAKTWIGGDPDKLCPLKKWLE